MIVGWTIEYGVGGIETPLVFMVLAGLGQIWALSPSNTYCVDVMQNRSSEVLAINKWVYESDEKLTTSCVRYCFAAGISAGCLPMIESIGVGWSQFPLFTAGSSDADCTFS